MTTSRFEKRSPDLEVTGLEPLPATLEAWESELLESALPALLDVAPTDETKEVGDGEAS
jgi:hypothetical protein